MLYVYMNQIYSSRKIEKACRRDINFMWLLEGKEVAGHVTITWFRYSHFAPDAKRIMANTCQNGKQLLASQIKQQKTQTGYDGR